MYEVCRLLCLGVGLVNVVSLGVGVLGLLNWFVPAGFMDIRLVCSVYFRLV